LFKGVKTFGHFLLKRQFLGARILKFLHLVGPNLNLSYLYI